MIDEKKIAVSITSGKFDEVINEIAHLNYDEIESIFFTLAYDTGSITVYSFICFWLMKYETAELHYIASVVLTQALNYLEGAYNSGLYHARRAIELSPNDVELKEYLLLFYEIPERVISYEEALSIATEILKIKPDSMAAKSFFKYYAR